MKLLCAVLALLLAGCSSSVSSGSFDPGNAPPTTHAIIYFLSGTARSADLTLTTSGGGQSQQSGVNVPLTNNAGTRGLRFDADSGQFLYISAQNNGDGTLTCRITEDGQTVSTNTSDGEFAIVTCDGTA